MGIDVSAERVIHRSTDVVADFATNPENDTAWISGIREVKVMTNPPFGKGTQVERVASFLGRRVEYVLEVIEFDPTARVVMHSVKSPFPMQVPYEFGSSDAGTRARIRIQGDAGRFYRLTAHMMSRSVKRSITEDLENLKRRLEAKADHASAWCWPEPVENRAVGRISRIARPTALL